MSHDVVVHWIERSPELHEARVTTADGRDVYAGYVAVTPGEDAWRGYVGAAFMPVGHGPRPVVQAAIERAVRDAWRHAGALDGDRAG